MKVCAIGDIHTKVQIIDAVENIIDDYDKIIFVGDYADDWHQPASKTIDVWRRLYKLVQDYPDKIVCLIGNHDYIYVNNTESKASGYNLITQALITFPENRNIYLWLKEMPVIIDVDGVLYSHAGISEDFMMDNNHMYSSEELWQNSSPIWLRPGESSYLNASQVFGHTPCSTCYQVEPNIWCIDTFSTSPSGTPYGDQTILEVVDGKVFNIIKLEVTW